MRIRLTIAFLLALLSLAFVSCQRKAPAELRMGISAWPGYEFFYLAKVKGYYADEKLNVTLVELGSLSDIRRSYERGQINLFNSTLFEILQTRALTSNIPRIISVSDYSHGADVILASPDVADIASLKGKKVGVEHGTINIYLLGRALEKNNLSLADITLIGSDQESPTAA